MTIYAKCTEGQFPRLGFTTILYDDVPAFRLPFLTLPPLPPSSFLFLLPFPPSFTHGRSKVGAKKGKCGIRPIYLNLRNKQTKKHLFKEEGDYYLEKLIFT